MRACRGAYRVGFICRTTNPIIAYNLLCEGDCLQDLERLRNDEAYLDALGASRIPDPTTAGDFCRRFERGGEAFHSGDQVMGLMDAINSVRVGAIVNNGGFSITLAQPFLGTTNDGGFTSEGGGTTTLVGANTYNGSTKVSWGTLVIGVNGALPNTSVAITGGTLQLGAGAGLAQMTSLSITGNGVLDV